MTPLATVLLIDEERRLEAAFRAALESEPGLRLLVTANPLVGRALAREESPDLVAVGSVAARQGPDGFGVTADTERSAAPPLLVKVTWSAAGPAAAEPVPGFDEHLILPLEPAELHARLLEMLHLKRAYDRLRADELELKRLQQAVIERREQLLQVLLALLEMAVPGAAERGRRIAELALRLADRLDIPVVLRGDLELAARLHELGRMFATDGERPTGAATPPGQPWQQARLARNVLKQVDALAGAADMIGGIYENWDGTGFPEHRLQGQIPLRCRILRMLIDFFATLDGPGQPSPAVALAVLAEHAGTRYDPMVLVHFQAMLGEAPNGDLRGPRVVLPVTELRVGMVLASDLYTESGIKLLAQNTRLTPAALETILRRHRLEPTRHGVAVLRSSL